MIRQRRSQHVKHQLYLPWRVVRNWHGKIAIVDARNNDGTTTTGRVCNLPQGDEGRGVFIAQEICNEMNARMEERSEQRHPVVIINHPHRAAD